MTDPPKDEGDPAPGDDTHRETVFSDLLVQELAEVYLLLDNIAAVATKAVPDLNGDPVFARPVFGRRATWIEQICEIRWPPGKHPHERESLSAAKLIRAKDALNAAAWPASGMSIAFTLMMSNDPPNRRLRRVLPKNGGAEKPHGADRHAGVPASNDRLEMHGPGSSRLSLAERAFPALAKRIWRHRLINCLLMWFLVLALVATSLFSWDVAAGSAMLNRVNTLKAVQTVASQKGSKPIDAPAAPATPSPGPTDGPSVSELRVPLDNLRRWVEANGFLGDLVGGRHESARNAPVLLTTRTTKVTTVQRCRAVARTSGAVCLAPIPGNPTCGNSVTSVSTTDTASLPETNVEWAAVMIGVLAGTVLPFCYGMLGASAAVMRNIVARMNASTLMPRDLVLSLVQLGLGAVIGTCVGLFVTPDGGGVGGDNGLLGPVRLSTAALCFLGGFGVEGVFRALESLVSRVFPVGSAPAPQGRPPVPGAPVRP